MILKWNQPNIHNIGGLFLLQPGVNIEVKTSDWEKAKKIPLIQHYLQTKDLEVVDATGNNDDLSAFSVSEAVKLVAETFDRNVLNQWLKTDKRSTVTNAIQAQLDKVKVEPKDASKK